MTRDELLSKCAMNLGAASGCHLNNQHEHYAKHMSALLDLLLEELIGSATIVHTKNARPFNPEEVLADIALAIKHRCYSKTGRWCIIFFHERICCVPTYENVPTEIILGEFTERMVLEGFTVVYWNQLKTNVIKLYRELHK